MINRKEKLAVIHIAKKQCCPDDNCYRELLLSCAGVESAAELKSEAQFNSVMAAFEKLGFKKDYYKSAFKKTTVPGVNSSWITPRQEYYIKGLWRLASRSKTEDSLRALLKRLTGQEEIRWIEKRKATNVIIALRDICARAGFNPDKKPVDKKEVVCF